MGTGKLRQRLGRGQIVLERTLNDQVNTLVDQAHLHPADPARPEPRQVPVVPRNAGRERREQAAELDRITGAVERRIVRRLSVEARRRGAR